MFLFKTKTRSALTVSVTLLTGYGTYDKYELNQVKSKFIEEASVLAKQPMKVDELPRKVLVYTAPSQYAAMTFKNYVKPVFDAAALDYELVLVEKEGDVAQKVCEWMWTGKEEASKRPEISMKTEQEKKSRTWMEFLFSKRSSKQNLDPIAAFLARPLYSPEIGLIALGPEAWEEMLKGIHTGCFSTRPPVEEKKDADSSDAATESTEPSPPDATSTTQNKLSTEHLPSPTPSTLPILEFNTFDLPPLGYIPASNLVGWKNFPMRIFNWFHEREIMQEMGEKALDVVFAHSHSIRNSNLDTNQLPEEITSRLVVYVARKS